MPTKYTSQTNGSVPGQASTTADDQVEVYYQFNQGVVYQQIEDQENIIPKAEEKKFYKKALKTKLI